MNVLTFHILLIVKYIVHVTNVIKTEHRYITDKDL